MLGIYVIGIVEQQNQHQICRLIGRGSGQECWLLMSLFQDAGEVNYFVLPETVYQKLPFFVGDD